jgi:predicted ABC-type ATPase
MHKPRLLVIAGCNGSGKSSFSKYLVPSPNTIPFDYDSHFLSHYRALMDIDIKEQMAHNLASSDLNVEISLMKQILIVNPYTGLINLKPKGMTFF